jgi:apolipoprotein N-acyltransferase
MGPDSFPGRRGSPSVWAKAAIAGGVVLVTSTLMFWGTGLHPLWWMTWLAPVPILLLSLSLPPWPAFGLAVLAWFLGSLNLWHYLLEVLGLPLLLVVIFSILPGCLFGFAVLLFRRFALGGAVWKAPMACASFWVSCEYLNNLGSPHGTFSNLSYTQMDCLPVVQLASLTGIWGIGFCLMLIPATLAVVLSGRGNARQRGWLAAGVTLWLLAVLVYGSRRLMATPPRESLVKVGLLATGAGSTFPHDDPTAMELLRDYAAKTESLVTAGAEVVVLPEKIAVVSDEGTGQVDALYSGVATQAKATLVLGLDRGTATRRVNEARVYAPTSPVLSYAKHHLVPGFEDVDIPGTEIRTFNRPSGEWGVQICKDLDFPGLSRKYAARGTALLLVPAWDFTLDGWLHGRMAILRGVESGFSVARAAKQGILSVSDDRGRVLAERDAATVPFASLLADVPVRHDTTLYARWGDWFAWLNVAAGIALLFSPSSPAKRMRPNQ